MSPLYTHTEYTDTIPSDYQHDHQNASANPESPLPTKSQLEFNQAIEHLATVAVSRYLSRFPSSPFHPDLIKLRAKDPQYKFVMIALALQGAPFDTHPVPFINDDGEVVRRSGMEAAEALYFMCRRHLNCQFDWDKPRLESLEVVLLLETYCAQTGKIAWRWRWNSMADRLIKIFRINEDPEELWNAEQEAAKNHHQQTLNEQILAAFTDVLMYEDLQPASLDIQVSTWFARERRRRLYWSCFENDVKAAVIGSRPPPFYKPSLKPGYPCTHAMWMAVNPIDGERPSLPQNECRMDIGIALTSLHRILLDIHQLVWHTDPSKVVLRPNYMSAIRDMERKLFEMELPPMTVEKLISTAKAPGVESGLLALFVNMFYQFCHLYLHQPVSHSLLFNSCLRHICS